MAENSAKEIIGSETYDALVYAGVSRKTLDDMANNGLTVEIKGSIESSIKADIYRVFVHAQDSGLGVEFGWSPERGDSLIAEAEHHLGSAQGWGELDDNGEKLYDAVYNVYKNEFERENDKTYDKAQTVQPKMQSDDYRGQFVSDIEKFGWHETVSGVNFTTFEKDFEYKGQEHGTLDVKVPVEVTVHEPFDKNNKDFFANISEQFDSKFNIDYDRISYIVCKQAAEQGLPEVKHENLAEDIHNFQADVKSVKDLAAEYGIKECIGKDVLDRIESIGIRVNLDNYRRGMDIPEGSTMHTAQFVLKDDKNEELWASSRIFDFDSAVENDFIKKGNEVISTEGLRFIDCNTQMDSLHFDMSNEADRAVGEGLMTDYMREKSSELNDTIFDMSCKVLQAEADKSLNELNSIKEQYQAHMEARGSVKAQPVKAVKAHSGPEI